MAAQKIEMQLYNIYPKKGAFWKWEGTKRTNNKHMPLRINE